MFVVCAMFVSLLGQTTAVIPQPADTRTVKIIEAKLEAAVTTKTPEISFTVLNQGKEPVSKIQVFATLFDAARKPTPVVVVPQTIPALAGGEQKVVFLKPTLEKDGKYTGDISLRYDDLNSEKIAVEITRSTPATAEPAITVEDALGTQLNLAPFNDRAVHVKVLFNVTETGGTQQTLTPRLKSFAQKFEGDRKLSVPGKLHDPEPVTLGMKESKDAQVQIEGIKRAGEYIATVVFEKGTTYRTLPKTATIYARESWLIAALLIAMGVFLSFWLRVYYKYTRPRLVTENQVGKIQERLAELAGSAAGDEVAANVVKRLQADIRERWNALGRMDRAVGSPEIPLWEDKLQLLETWLKLRKLSARVPEDLRESYATAMSGAENVLDRTAATSKEISDANDALEKLIAPINAARTKGAELSFGRARTWEELKAKHRAIYRQLWLADRTAVGLALVLAIFLGLKTLWGTDLAWGGWVDHLTAFAWGFGLHQLTAGGVGAVFAEVKKALD